MKVKVKCNENIEMMKIENNLGETIFYGNYWDFHNNPKFIAEFLRKLGLEVKIIKSQNENF